jgi:hypothetical protein
VSLHVPISFWVFSEMCGPSCAHVFYCEFLYAKGMLKQKHVNAIYLFIFSMRPWYRVHGALKNAKVENIFMIFFNAGIGK